MTCGADSGAIAADRSVTSIWRDRACAPPVAAYLHIPFCRRRCFYCDFAVSVIGDRKNGSNSQAVQTYVDLLCREIAATPSRGRSLKTVFFGGGTPSLLTAAQIVRILETLERQFGIASGAEISIEIDPGTFDLAKLSAIAAAGVNRISLGIQTFDDRILQAIGRSHTADEIDTALEILAASAIDNFSIDLMAGLPHQTAEDWDATLDRALEISPQHLAYYDLIVEPGTVFDRYYEPGTAPLPSEAATAEMFCHAVDRLVAAGYHHYEIGSYARPGRECRHNLTYWHNRPYYGFGQGATSYVGGQRVSRPRKRQDYGDWLAAFCDRDGVSNAEAIAPIDLALESVMLKFRTSAGLDRGLLRSEILALTGGPAWERVEAVLARYEKSGAIAVVGDRVRLTDPEGFLLSNSVLSDLFNAIEGEDP